MADEREKGEHIRCRTTIPSETPMGERRLCFERDEGRGERERVGYHHSWWSSKTKHPDKNVVVNWPKDQDG